MLKKRQKIILLVAALVMIISGWWLINNKEKPIIEPEIEVIENQPAELAGMPNPASVNCLDKGGVSEIVEGPKGQYGICVFEDNLQCEEWALMNGACPEGGIKVTGYTNEEEKYCAITGNVVEDGKCLLPEGKECDLIEFYNGECR